MTASRVLRKNVLAWGGVISTDWRRRARLFSLGVKLIDAFSKIECCFAVPDVFSQL